MPREAEAKDGNSYYRSEAPSIDTTGRLRTGIIGSISQLARGCHQQPVEVGVSPSVNCGVPHRI
jgi:hypothetical protein